MGGNAVLLIEMQMPLGPPQDLLTELLGLRQRQLLICLFVCLRQNLYIVKRIDLSA